MAQSLNSTIDVPRGTVTIPDIVVKKSDLFDIGKLTILWLGMVKELYPDEKPNEKWWESYMVAFMNNINYHCYHALHHDKYVGFMDSLLLGDPISGKIIAQGIHCYVYPEYRERAGYALFSRMMKEGRKRKIEMFELNCAPTNKDYWEKHGMKCFGHHMRREL